jgi:DNA repair exonuclease SbcCD ATPase subunit
MSVLTIHAVNPTGMFSYGLCPQPVHLMNKGLIHLQGVNDDKGGDSNGSGKSSLFYAICEMLFQDNPTEMKGDDVINSVWGQGMAGRLLFTTTDQTHWRITYTRKWKKAFYEVDNDTSTNYVGTGLYLDRFDSEARQWIDCRGSGMPQTKEKIKEIIGISYANFLAISFLSPRVGSRFLRGTNKERMTLLSGITGVEEWDSIQDKARKSRKQLQDQITQLNLKISHEQGSVDTLKSQLESLRSLDYVGKLSEAKKELQDLRDEYAAGETLLKSKKAAYTDLEEKRKSTLNVDIINQLNQEELSIKTDLAGVERSMVSRPVSADPNLQKELNDLTRDLHRTQGTLNSALHEGDNILSIDTCPVCAQGISSDKKQSILNERQTRVEAYQERINQLNEEIAKKQTCMQQDLDKKTSEEESRVNSLYLRAQELRGSLQDLGKRLTSEYEAYSAYDGVIREAGEAVQEAQEDLGRIRQLGSNKKSEVVLIEQKINDINSLEIQIQERGKGIKQHKGSMQELLKEVALYEWLISNIPSIKLLKLSESMKDITDLANEFLSNMGDSMRVNVSAFNEKSSSRNAASTMDLLKNEVKLEIYDGKKNIHPKLYSEGEIAKVSLAVAKAMYEMARKSGQGCNLMLLDEIFGYMDGNNAQRVAQSLQAMLTKGTVFLTDNSDKVRDLVTFNGTWTARKSNGCTQIEIGSAVQ